MISLISFALLAINASPHLELVNPGFVLPSSFAAYNSGDTTAFLGKEGDISFTTGNGWKYTRLPSVPFPRATQGEWLKNDFYVLSSNVLYRYNLLASRWDSLANFQIQKSASIAASQDSIVLLNSGTSFQGSSNGIDWSTIDTYAPDAAVFRGKKSWMAIDSWNIYEYDSLKWKYFPISTPIATSKARTKTGLVRCNGNSVTFHQVGSAPEWSIPIQAIYVTATPDGRIIAFSKDSVYHITDGKITYKSKLSIDIPKAPFYMNKKLNIKLNQTEICLACIITSDDGATWARLKGAMETIRTMSSTRGKIIAAGDSGTILVSSNGTDWKQSIAFNGRMIRSLTPTRNGVTAISDTGTLLTSIDGSSWTNIQTDLKKAITKIKEFDDTLYGVEKFGIWKTGNHNNWTQYFDDPTGTGSDLGVSKETLIYGNQRQIYYKAKGSSWDSITFPYNGLAICDSGTWASRGDSLFQIKFPSNSQPIAAIPNSGGITKLACSNEHFLAITSDSILVYKNGKRAFGIFPDQASHFTITGAFLNENIAWLYGIDGRIFRLSLEETSSTAPRTTTQFKTRRVSRHFLLDLPISWKPTVFSPSGKKLPHVEIGRSTTEQTIQFEPRTSGIYVVRNGTQEGLTFVALP